MRTTRTLSLLWRKQTLGAIMFAVWPQLTEAAALSGPATGGPEPLPPEVQELLREGVEFLANVHKELMRQLEDFRREHGEPGQSYGLRDPEFLPPLEYGLPYGLANDRDGWRQVQQVLQTAGLYDAPIDGLPGPQTYAALQAYLESFEQILVDRGAEAIRRGKNAAPWRDDHPGSGYGTSGEWAGEFRRVAVDGEFEMHPAGYTGYSSYRDGKHVYQFSYAFAGARDKTCRVHNDQRRHPELQHLDRLLICPLLNGELLLLNGYFLDVPVTSLVMDIDGVYEPLGELGIHPTPTRIPEQVIE